MPLEINAATTPANAPAPTDPAAAPAPAPAPMPKQTVPIPLEQLETFISMQGRLAQMEADQRTKEDAARAEQIKLMTQKGEIENAFKLQREEAQKQLDAERASRTAIEERAKRYALDGEVSRVLASKPLVPGGAEQLTQLLRGNFVVEPAGDSFTVRTPTFQSVGDFLEAQLARPEYAHFIRASNPTGGTAGGPTSAAAASPTAPAHPATPPTPKNFGEAIVLQIQDMQKASAGDPRMNVSAPMGLNRTSIVRQA